MCFRLTIGFAFPPTQARVGHLMLKKKRFLLAAKMGTMNVFVQVRNIERQNVETQIVDVTNCSKQT
jgi:hypothetical protein